MPTTKHEVYPTDDLAADVVAFAEEEDMSLSGAWQYMAREYLQLQEEVDNE